MPQEKWPTGPDYFKKTNTDAIIRNLEGGSVALGLSMPELDNFFPKPSHEGKKTSLMIKSPGLVLRDDVSKD